MYAGILGDDYLGIGDYDTTDFTVLELYRRQWLVLGADYCLCHHGRGMDAVGFLSILVESRFATMD